MPLADDPKLQAASDSVESYDPTAVPPISDPPSSSPAPEDDGSQRGDANGDEGGEQEPAAPLPQFDERHRQDFEGLLYLGALKDTFTWAGHRFTIRTLRNQELIDCGVAIKEYQGTDGQMKAFQTAVMAACLIDVDGRGVDTPVPVDLGKESDFEVRFHYMMRNWFPPTSDAIYAKYLELEIRTRKVMESLGGFSG